VTDVPQTTFRELGVSSPVVEALAARGIEWPFAIQTKVVPDALEGVDVLAKSPTGSGKTLAFGIPLVDRLAAGAATPAALVLVPTRELAVQVAGEMNDIATSRGLRVAVAYGGVPIAKQRKAVEQAHILVATPGRLEDLCRRRMVSLRDVSIFILDEADRMLDMGFQPQVDEIVRRLPRARQTMFFSATLDGEVGRLARAYTSHAARHELADAAEAAEDVDHRFLAVTSQTKLKILIDLLSAEDGLSLVFVRTKQGADRLVSRLRERGVPALAMHGDMQQRARERALQRFDSGRVRVLVATDIAARGLDLEKIGTVINYDPPEDGKGYVHRVGRTGRAGRAGTGVTLVLDDQQADVSRIAARLDLADEFTSSGMAMAPPRLVYSSRRSRRSRW
jgi:ATP-dependent RNA helicase DeaD/ATP-dependent RNA helicase RhlE